MLSKKEVQHVLEGYASLMVGFWLADKPRLRVSSSAAASMSVLVLHMPNQQQAIRQAGLCAA